MDPGHGDITTCRLITADVVPYWGPGICCGIGVALALLLKSWVLTLISLKGTDLEEHEAQSVCGHLRPYEILPNDDFRIAHNTYQLHFADIGNDNCGVLLGRSLEQG